MKQDRPGVGYSGGGEHRFGFRDRQVREVERRARGDGSRVEVR